MARKNPFCGSATTFCIALAFICGFGFSQSTTQSDSPPDQYSHQSQGGAHTNSAGNKNQRPSTRAAPITEPSLSDHPQSIGNEEQSEKYDESNNGNEGTYYGMKPADWVNVALTTIIAFFTGLLWWVSRRQADLMDKQAEIMDRQNRLIRNSERAFVFVDFIKCIAHMDQNRIVRAREIPVRFENFGNTPAKNLRVIAIVEVREDALPDDFAFREPENFHQRTLGPRVSTDTRVIVSGGDVCDATIGKKHIYVWGSAKYRDTLDGSAPHVTTFCCKIIVIGDPRTIPAPGDQRENPSLTFENHKTHNDAN